LEAAARDRPVADAPSLMATLIHGRPTTLPARSSSTRRPTEDVAHHLAGATDQATREDREVGWSSIARQKSLIVSPDGSAIMPEGVESPAARRLSPGHSRRNPSSPRAATYARRHRRGSACGAQQRWLARSMRRRSHEASTSPSTSGRCACRAGETATKRGSREHELGIGLSTELPFLPVLRRERSVDNDWGQIPDPRKYAAHSDDS
jgi:hypothetical protein